MAVLNAGHLTGGTSALATPSIASIKIPANTLVLAVFRNQNATPANLAHPALAGPGSVTWVELGTVTGTVASVTRRETVFACMSDADVTGSPTVTGNGIAQAWGWSFDWKGGVTTAGLNGAGAVAQVKTASSGNTSQTNLPIAFDNAFGKATNGVYAAFYGSAAAGMTAKTNYTELYDDGAGLEVQFLASNDSTPNVTATSGTMLGIAVELVAVPNAVTSVPSPTITIDGNVLYGATSRTLTLFAKKLNILMVSIEGTAGTIPTDITITTPGITWHDLYNDLGTNPHHNCRAKFVWCVTDADGSYVTTLTPVGGSGNLTWGTRMHYVNNVDFTAGAGALAGSGILQTATTNGAATGSPSISLAAFTSRDNATVQLWSYNSNDASITYETGWQGIGNASINGINSLLFACRANADDTPSFTFASNQAAMGIALEIQTAPVVVEGDPPVITLVSPAEGALASDDVITIETTDPDADIVFVMIVAGLGTAAEVVYDWGASGFESGYGAASERDTVTNGWSWDIARDSGWPDDVTITVVAVDAEGHVTTEAFEWTVAAPAFDPCLNPVPPVRPGVTVVSPLPYNNPSFPIDPESWFVLHVTDPDAAPGQPGGLGRVSLWVFYPDDDTDAIIHTGEDFRPGFAGSTREAIDGGWEITCRPASGRWTKAPEFVAVAVDLTGLEAA